MKISHAKTGIAPTVSPHHQEPPMTLVEIAPPSFDKTGFKKG
jgi:hypothetical protein